MATESKTHTKPKPRPKPKPKAEATPAPVSNPTPKSDPDADLISIEITTSLPSQYNPIGERLQTKLGKDPHFTTLEIHHPRGMDIMSGSKNKFRHILETKYDVHPMNIVYIASLPFQGNE